MEGPNCKREKFKKTQLARLKLKWRKSCRQSKKIKVQLSLLFYVFNYRRVNWIWFILEPNHWKLLLLFFLNSKADLEDALSPTWENLISGQVNLKDAVDGTISFHDKVRNRVYKLNDQTAKLFVRPRGWHLPEAHILIDGEPATGCLVDFGLYFYHNHSAFRRTQGAGFGPFFYLPKMEHSR